MKLAFVMKMLFLTKFALFEERKWHFDSNILGA